MEYNEFKKMMREIRDMVYFYKNHVATCTAEGLARALISWVMVNYFWDDKTNTPTCDVKQMQILIQNTFQSMLHPD